MGVSSSVIRGVTSEESLAFGSWYVLHTGPGMCLCPVTRFGDLPRPQGRDVRALEAVRVCWSALK